jgi:hypothetical protein
MRATFNFLGSFLYWLLAQTLTLSRRSEAICIDDLAEGREMTQFSGADHILPVPGGDKKKNSGIGRTYHCHMVASTIIAAPVQRN